MRLNFTLEVGAATTITEVTAAAESPLLTTSAVVGGIVTGDQILHLPLIDQNAANLALTQAQFAGGIGGGVSVAGGSTMTLATTVNGISVSNNRLDRAGGLLSFQLTQTVDMVEEVKVTSSPVDAENGRSLGSVSDDRPFRDEQIPRQRWRTGSAIPTSMPTRSGTISPNPIYPGKP